VTFALTLSTVNQTLSLPLDHNMSDEPFSRKSSTRTRGEGEIGGDKGISTRADLALLFPVK
jgi:hypothetical protein